MGPNKEKKDFKKLYLVGVELEPSPAGAWNSLNEI
jgi:hypothetical protein